MFIGHVYRSICIDKNNLYYCSYLLWNPSSLGMLSVLTDFKLGKVGKVDLYRSATLLLKKIALLIGLFKDAKQYQTIQ